MISAAEKSYRKQSSLSEWRCRPGGDQQAWWKVGTLGVGIRRGRVLQVSKADDEGVVPLLPLARVTPKCASKIALASQSDPLCRLLLISASRHHDISSNVRQVHTPTSKLSTPPREHSSGSETQHTLTSLEMLWGKYELRCQPGPSSYATVERSSRYHVRQPTSHIAWLPRSSLQYVPFSCAGG